MYADVPNFANVFGYVNASWTLRADLTCEYVCRLLNRMTESGMRQCTARMRDEDRSMERRPWIVGFMPGYMARSMHLFPQAGRSRSLAEHAELPRGQKDPAPPNA